MSEARLENEPSTEGWVEAEAAGVTVIPHVSEVRADSEADELNNAVALPDFVRSSDGALVTADDRDGNGVRESTVCVDVAVDESEIQKDRVGLPDAELDAANDGMSREALLLVDADEDGNEEREKLLLPETLVDADGDGESRELLEIHDEALVLGVSRGELLTDEDGLVEPDELGDNETDAVVVGEIETDTDGCAVDDSHELPDTDAEALTLGEARGERLVDEEIDADIDTLGEIETDAETDGECVDIGDADMEQDAEGEWVIVGDADVDRDTEGEWVIVGDADVERDAEDDAVGDGDVAAHMPRSSSQTKLAQSLSNAHVAPKMPLCISRPASWENKPAEELHTWRSNSTVEQRIMCICVQSFVVKAYRQIRPGGLQTRTKRAVLFFL